MYKIGQLLFIIANKTKTIEPVQIVSKQTLEDLEGTTIQHLCKFVDGVTFSLEKHEEEKLIVGVFETVEDAQAHLLSLASDMARQLAEIARQKSAKFVSEQSQVRTHELPSASPGNGDLQVIELPDGTKARLHLPAELQ